MAENTLQLEWIVLLKFGLEACYDEIQDVFVAADLLWYPVEGHPEINVAPDVMVAFGRPKGHRGSYIQFVEDNVAPQVVFEIISPGNRKKEMENKLAFYQKYGIQEYYTYDPQRNIFQIYVRSGEELVQYTDMREWVSPRLKVKFEWNEVTLNIFEPDGDPFLSYHELREFKKHPLSRRCQRRRSNADPSV
jgi:Uma2 family endonuclease